MSSELLRRKIRKRLFRLLPLHRTSVYDNYEKIIFFHIHKCAGQSTYKYIYDYFRAKKYPAFKLHYQEGNDTNNDKLMDIIEKINNTNSFCFVYVNAPFNYIEKIEGKKFIFTFIRDPEKRLFSQYRFLHDHLDNFPDSKSIYKDNPEFIHVIETVRNLNYEEFITIQDRHVDYYRNNFMARSLAGILDTDFDEKELVNKLNENIPKLSFFGEVENYNRDFEMLLKMIGLVKISIPKYNKSKKINVNKSMNNYHNTENIHKKIKEYTKFDYMLVNAVKRLSEKNNE